MGEPMKRQFKSQKEAIFIAIMLVGTVLFVPSFTSTSENKQINYNHLETSLQNPMLTEGPDLVPYDQNYYPEPDLTLRADQNDINYNVDTGNQWNRARDVYIGEYIDGAPGRGRKGYLEPTGQDVHDFYRFSVCAGQTISGSMTTNESYLYELLDHEGNPVSNGYTAVESGYHYIHIYDNGATGFGEYFFDVTISGQNDANLGFDAGDTISTANHVAPGVYTGYLDMNDWEDWYSFDVTNGDGIFITVEPHTRSDYDIYLYNPSDEQVYYAQYYGEDTLEYPADVTGTWKIKIDIFPGWDTSKYAEDYYYYGSGYYDLEISIGGTANPPPALQSQPEIYPVAQSFIVDNDPDSNSDEYAYLAAVPAANYVEDNKRYLSPIFYRGDTTPTNWAGDVDDTTQYLIDDWNTYLSRHTMDATEHELSSDPVQAAADIAITQWTSSDTAVVVVDGSTAEDTIKTRVDRNIKLNAKTKTTSVTPDSGDILEIGDLSALPMFIGPKWGCMAVHGLGASYRGDIGLITPRYEALMDDWWPFPDDANGPDTDVCYPITMPGFWLPYSADTTGLTEMQITLIEGKRFRIPISNVDCSLKVTVTTDSPSYLRIYIIDPYGNVRRPMVPHWNGGPVNPLHVWNGGHWSGIGFDDWRFWEPVASTEHVEEVHYPMKGIWRVIVVPASLEHADQTYDFHVTIEERRHTTERASAALSAANGAVIASGEHIPLLYVAAGKVSSVT